MRTPANSPRLAVYTPESSFLRPEELTYESQALPMLFI